MKQQIDEFIEYMDKIKGTSRNTLLSYRRDLMRMAAYMQERGITDASLVTEDAVQDYCTELRNENFAPASITRHSTSIKSFFRYMLENGNITENPAEKIKSPKIEKKQPRVLTAVEIENLLSQDFGKDPKGLRDRAILELMYSTGLKASEVINLNLSNVDLSLSCIRLAKKGSDKVRLIPYGRKAKEALQSYLTGGRNKLLECRSNGEIERNETEGEGLSSMPEGESSMHEGESGMPEDVSSMHDDESRLFLNCSGIPMSRQGLWKLIKNYVEKAGIRSDITPFTLRHSFAMHLIDNGADIASVQELMGYSDSNTVSKYIGKKKSTGDPYEWARIRN